MHSIWFSSTFLRFLKFPQIKEMGPNFLGEPILRNIWIIWSPILYFNFRNLKDPNPSSFIRFQCILYDSAGLFSAFSKCIILKRGDLNSWGELILQNGWIICPLPPLLYLNFRNLKDSNFWSFIQFQCILYDSAVLFPNFWNFLKLKRWDLFSLGGSKIPQNG